MIFSSFFTPLYNYFLNTTYVARIKTTFDCYTLTLSWRTHAEQTRLSFVLSDVLISSFYTDALLNRFLLFLSAPNFRVGLFVLCCPRQEIIHTKAISGMEPFTRGGKNIITWIGFPSVEFLEIDLYDIFKIWIWYIV